MALLELAASDYNQKQNEQIPSPKPKNNQAINKNPITQLNLAKSKSMFSKSSCHLISRSKSKLRSKEIIEENCRLITRIIEIKERRPTKYKKCPVMTSNKMQNPQRAKRIQMQNQRLGKSLLMIKSGKTLERIKTQIAQEILKMTDTSCSRRINTSQSISQNLFLDCSLPSLTKSNNSTFSDNWNKSIDIDCIPRRRKKDQAL